MMLRDEASRHCNRMVFIPSRLRYTRRTKTLAKTNRRATARFAFERRSRGRGAEASSSSEVACREEYTLSLATAVEEFAANINEPLKHRVDVLHRKSKKSPELSKNGS